MEFDEFRFFLSFSYYQNTIFFYLIHTGNTAFSNSQPTEYLVLYSEHTYHTCFRKRFRPSLLLYISLWLIISDKLKIYSIISILMIKIV